jgi:hypothetical protein
MAIGQATIAWNALHETSRDLFAAIMDETLQVGDEQNSLCNAAWHAMTSDRFQRNMLMGVAKQAHASGKISSSAWGSVKWVLDEANKLAQARNDAVHSPLISLISPDVVQADSESGHPGAKRLEQKHLLSDLRWCRDSASVLNRFCRQLTSALVRDLQTTSLPHRPGLPNRGQKRTRQVPRRRLRPKSPPRPHRSSYS